MLIAGEEAIPSPKLEIGTTEVPAEVPIIAVPKVGVGVVFPKAGVVAVVIGTKVGVGVVFPKVVFAGVIPKKD